MKYLRFESDGQTHFGVLDGSNINKLAGSYFPRGECDVTGDVFELSDVRLLPPTLPSKVVLVGLNYRDHAEEFGNEIPKEPCLFMKPETAVIGPEAEIVYPAMTRRLDYEAELGIVIGNTLKSAGPEEVRDGILGYTCLNDVTARDLQISDGQWTRSKSFDTFCPIGPWITDDVEPDDLEISLYLNGERRQHSRTSRFVFPAHELVSFISQVMTLRPGDVIGTGTSSGVGPMVPGNVVEVRIVGIGTLRNTVALPKE